MSTVPITVEGQPSRDVPLHSSIAGVMHAAYAPDGLPWIAAMVNNDLVGLQTLLDVGSVVHPITMRTPEGAAVYERSLGFLLAKVVNALFRDADLSVNYTMGDGVYCTLNRGVTGGHAPVSTDELQQIEASMREQVARDLPIERRKVSFAEAVRCFEKAGQTDKLRLLRFRNSPRLALYRCEGFYDMPIQPLAPSTGVLSAFAIRPYPPGFLLLLPQKCDGLQVAPFQNRPKLFQVFQEREAWGRILGVETVGRMNELIADGGIGDFIKMAEALHEKKIACIADEIAARRGAARMILIAGPSSSGKTTFAKRLAIQLRVAGLRPVTISLDDYFFDRNQTPRDESGAFDFEHLDALNLPLFNRHINELLDGRKVALPRFNFETHTSEICDTQLCIEPDQPLIVEGIHALNPGLTAGVPDACKFRIYVSALTQLSLDSHNRISTTDNRLLRRIVRDNQYRKHSALDTLRMWPSVRRGEARWVFPFQENADVMFNSALDYELSVLKPIVEQLLFQIKPDVPEYAASRRLTALLFPVLPLSGRGVPPTSILREVIGRSSFTY
ncbi:MAG: nucleoside kinase [bacterium]